MNQKQVKLLRGQIRQIVKELLPTLVTEALVVELSKELKKEVVTRLDAIDQRQKDISGYVVRNSGEIAPTKE